ncbi:MAG: N-acetyltransferase family protein [Planctomycetota bacterium]
MTALVRLAAAPDFDAIAALVNWFVQHTAAHFGTEPVTADALRAEAAAAPFGAVYPWLVAELDGAFAGYAKAGPWRGRAAYAWTAETGIYLQAGARGRGIGRTLYTRLLATLRAQGFRSVVAGATLPNAASEQLHRALGFVPCGVVRDAGWKRGAWHDVGFWQLRLGTDDGAPRLLTPEEAFARS